MIEALVTLIHSEVTDPCDLFLRLSGTRMRNYDYTTGQDDVVPCMAFWRVDFFHLMKLRGTQDFRVFLYEGCISSMHLKITCGQAGKMAH